MFVAADVFPAASCPRLLAFKAALGCCSVTAPGQTRRRRGGLSDMTVAAGAKLAGLAHFQTLQPGCASVSALHNQAQQQLSCHVTAGRFDLDVEFCVKAS